MAYIAKNCIAEIIEHAKAIPSHEACGLLSGKDGRIERAYKMKNDSVSPEHCYFMDPKEQLKTMKEIRRQGHEMLGIYHSHPASPAYPSAKDVELAFYPEAVYVIVSLASIDQPEVKAYKIESGKIAQEELINA